MNVPTHGGNLVWAAQIAACSPHALLDFSASINPLGMPDSAAQALQSALSTLTTYPDPSYTHLKQAIASHHQIDPDWILPGNGAAELLTWACRDLAAQKATYLITPAFADYDRALRAARAKVRRCPLASPDWPLLQVPGLPKLLTSQSAIPQDYGILLNNPHNPTGQLIDAGDLKTQILDNPYYRLVVIDEAFMDFLPIDRQHSLISLVADYPQLIILRSLTKFYAIPGLRLGYAIAHPDRFKQWQTWRDPWSVNTLAARVGEVVLGDRNFQTQTYAWLETAQPKLKTDLAQIPGLVIYPSCVNFLLVRSPVPVPALQAQLLKKHQIYIRDCLSFAELGEFYFRIAVRTIEENDRLVEALREMLRDFAVS